MFLKRITVTGFKSFANKTVLDLEPGITAIVGPNGSGKSNLADAVRWALGEQSKGRLRLSDREEVVFAGTTKRAKASFAEVILLFDNQDGAFPLDLTEVEISRRLYRNGEAEYRLGRRAVRLSDIQALLAEAGFGANTYAVIGQGMIDSFLLSSPAERKLLFDEAAGIRGPELKREAALRKLTATEANLVRLRDILAEISPRLATLEKTMASANDRANLEQKIGHLRQTIIGARLDHWTQAHAGLVDQLKQADHHLERWQAECTDFEQRLQAAQAADDRLAATRTRLQAELIKLEAERDAQLTSLAGARGAVAEATHQRDLLDGLTAQLATAQDELAQAQARQSDLTAEIASNADIAGRAQKAVERAGRDVSEAQAALVAIRKSTSDGTRDQYVDHALQIIKTLAMSLGNDDMTLDQVRLLIHKAGRLLSHATRSNAVELLANIKAAQKQLEAAMGRRETAIEHQTNITITRRSLEIDLSHQAETVRRLTDRVAQIQSIIQPAQANAAQLPALERQLQHTEAALKTATTHIEQQRAQLKDLVGSSAGPQGLVQLAGSLERTKAALATAETQRVDLDRQRAEAEAELAAAHKQAKDWGIEPIPAASHSTLADLSEQLLRAEAALEAKTAAAAEQLVEYEEVTARAQDLATQIADLQAAQTDLVQVVTQLEELVRTRFRENFQALAKQFATYFTQLFDGGNASLELEEGESGTYGIAIKASPKGKRLTQIAALSGGERAMAGVALLAAILRVNPSPFVVLDEIDAALDEANSGRLASILDELSQHSQLIVITHNRQTMQAAQVLFGVTLSEHHVSHLLSMRLEDATKLAAR